jgi:hypothetical protein
MRHPVHHVGPSPSTSASPRLEASLGIKASPALTAGLTSQVSTVICADAISAPLYRGDLNRLLWKDDLYASSRRITGTIRSPPSAGRICTDRSHTDQTVDTAHPDRTTRDDNACRAACVNCNTRASTPRTDRTPDAAHPDRTSREDRSVDAPYVTVRAWPRSRIRKNDSTDTACTKD